MKCFHVEGGKMTIWMEVTQDKYELPVAVAASAAELARIRGVKQNTVVSAAWRARLGKYKRSKYVSVEVEDDE